MDATNNDPAYTTHSLTDFVKGVRGGRLVEIKVYDDETLDATVVYTDFFAYSDGFNKTRVETVTREEARAVFTAERAKGLRYTGPWRSSRFAPAAVGA